MDHTELGRRMHGAFNNRDFDAVDDIFARDFYSHPLDGGRDVVRASWQAMAEMYPEAFTAIDDVFTQGDRVAMRSTVHGLADDGQSATLVEIFRVADGRIAELWGAKGTTGASARNTAAAPG